MMKSTANKQKKGVTAVVLAAMLLTVLCMSQPAFSEVSLAGSWATGTSHTKEAGTARALIFIAHEESTIGTPTLTSVTYGGQTMTKVIEASATSSGYGNYVAAFILKEAGVAAATSGTFTPTWSGATSSVSYASVFLSNVNQTEPNGAEASNSTTSDTNPIATDPLATNDGDMVILGATCGNAGTYTLGGGFTEGTDQTAGGTYGHTGVTGHKPATGAAETPSATYNTGPNRQVIIGFVVNETVSDPNIASNPDPADGADNVSISTDLSWDAPSGYTPTSYDVYFGTNPTAHSNPKYRVDTNSYDPPGDLEIDTTYYWAVDSNDAGTIHPGDDWNFTTLVQVGDRVAGNMMLINDNAGWCWYQDDKIIYDPVSACIITSTSGGDLGFGGASGENRSSNVDATTFNIATGKRTRSLMCTRGGDDHNMGAFWIRPDGKYLHVYAQHYSPQVSYFRITANPNDGTSWGSEQSYNWNTISGLGSSNNLTYTNLHYLSTEGTGNGRLYNIVRWHRVTPNISYSDDWGQTWQYAGRLSDPVGPAGYSYYYHKFRSNGVDRIDFICTEQHPRDYRNSVYHGYIKGGKSYNSSGTVIDDNLYDQNAPGTNLFTPVWLTGPMAAGEYHTGWTNELELDKNGYPVCLFQTRYGTDVWGDGSGQNNTGAADHRFFYGRFNGTSWSYTELAKMGTGLHWKEQDYLGMGCIHPDDVNLIYISTNFDPVTDVNIGKHEIFKGVTSDNGEHWDWTQITFDSTVDNIRPAIPKWGAYNTAVFWERGDFPTQGHFDMVLVGMVEEENVTVGKVSYIDASESNTTESDDTPFTPTGPSGSPGAVDNQWHEYTGYGNGGSCYTAGDSGTENAPTIKTAISGLSDGTYDVFAYFWCDPNLDWGIRGGFTSSDLLCFNKQSSQHAEALQFSGPVTVTGTGVILYRVYIGRKEISGGTPVVVYIDNYDSSYTVNAPTRTTYDGVGVASVITGAIPGDLNGDGKVNLIDIAVLGQGWLTIYDMYTLADIADNWLYGT